MDFWFYLLVPILTDIAIALFVPYFFLQTKKEQNEDAFVYKTHAPRRSFVISISLLIIVSAFFTVGTILIITLNLFTEIAQWMAYSFSVLFIWLIFALLFLVIAVPYEVINKDSIMVFRWIKKKQYSFSEIGSYKYSFNQLTVLDKNGKVLFFVGDNRVGIKSIINSLEEHYIRESK